MSAVAPRPEYVGGPLCGDPVERPEERGVTVTNPTIGKTHQGRGVHVYERSALTGDFVHVREGE